MSDIEASQHPTDTTSPYVDHMPAAYANASESTQDYIQSTMDYQSYLMNSVPMTEPFYQQEYPVYASPASSISPTNTPSSHFPDTPPTGASTMGGSGVMVPESLYATDYVDSTLYAATPAMNYTTATASTTPLASPLSFDYTYDKSMHTQHQGQLFSSSYFGQEVPLSNGVPTSAPPAITTFQQAYDANQMVAPAPPAPIAQQLVANTTTTPPPVEDEKFAQPALKVKTAKAARKKSTTGGSARKSTSGAPPGPIPATTPTIVKRDDSGVEWISFEYSKERIKKTYEIRCDVEAINHETLPEDFRQENCIYPRACVPAEQYTGNRQRYETECNAIGWCLAWLNPDLRGQRGLIQRAVDSWRNTNADPSYRSRRVRRMSKKSISSAASSAATSPKGAGIGKRSKSVCENRNTPALNRSCSQPSLALAQHSYPSQFDMYEQQQQQQHQPPQSSFPAFNNPFAPGQQCIPQPPPPQQPQMPMGQLMGPPASPKSAASLERRPSAYGPV